MVLNPHLYVHLYVRASVRVCECMCKKMSFDEGVRSLSRNDGALLMSYAWVNTEMRSTAQQQQGSHFAPLRQASPGIALAHGELPRSTSPFLHSNQAATVQIRPVEILAGGSVW